MTEYWPIVLQTFVIIIAIIAGVKRGENRISRCETKIEHLELNVRPIPGISRAVARLEGKVNQ